MVANTVKKSKSTALNEDSDYSLNELLLRGRVSTKALAKELPSGVKVVEFRLIVSRGEPRV